MEGGLFGGLGGMSPEGPMAAYAKGTAQRFGLTQTSGFRPGDPGWHGVGRAADFSNATGPTKEMMAFAQYLAATVGRNLKELIYTPLGYGIKNGKQVPPYARQGHYNHVHVAYALGAGNPILTPTKEMAKKIDAQAFGRANIKTFTAGNGEFGGGPTVNGGINVTVNAGGVNDPQELAAMVAWEIQQAIESNDSLFV